MDWDLRGASFMQQVGSASNVFEESRLWRQDTLLLCTNFAIGAVEALIVKTPATTASVL
jgi:hypothetical protein